MTGRESCESRTATLSSTAGRHAQVAFAGMRTSRSRVMRTYSSHPARKIMKKIAVTDRRRFFARNRRRNPIGGASKSMNLLYPIEHEIRWKVALKEKVARGRFAARVLPEHYDFGTTQSAGGNTTGQNFGEGRSNSNATAK